MQFKFLASLFDLEHAVEERTSQDAEGGVVENRRDCQSTHACLAGSAYDWIEPSLWRRLFGVECKQENSA